MLSKDVKKCLDELQCKIRSYSTVTDELITDILTQLTNLEKSKVENGLLLFNQLAESDQPMDIESHIGSVVMAHSQSLNFKGCKWDGTRPIPSHIFFEFVSQSHPIP